MAFDFFEMPLDYLIDRLVDPVLLPWWCSTVLLGGKSL